MNQPANPSTTSSVYQPISQWFKGDLVIWIVMLILATLSTLVVYSSASSLAYRHMQGNTEYYLIKHFLLVVGSLIAMWGAHRIDYRYYAGLAKLALWISVPMLLITWRYGLTFNEASRWLTIPMINKSFQTADLAQLALIIYIANKLAKIQHNMDNWGETLTAVLVWCGVTCGLIALTNLSAALLTFLSCMLLMYVGRVPTKFLMALALIGLLSGGIALCVGQRGETALSRLKNFTRDELPFQTEQAYIAIATGELYGKGPGNSQQRNFLPHPYSDFIYAVLVEEYGLIGGIVVVLLYLTLLYRSLRTVSYNIQTYGKLLATGLSLTLVLQAMVNMGVTTGLGPVTGLPLPFISMGGTSLLFTGIAVGIILSVSRGEIDMSIDQLQNAANTERNLYKKT